MQDQIPTKKSRIILLNAIVLTLICVVAAAAAGYFILQKNQETELNNNSVVRPTDRPSVRPRDGRDPVQPPVSEQADGPIVYGEDELVYGGEAPVYVTIYSHNEESWDSLVNTKEKYIKYRDGLLDRVNLIAEFGLEWDWQSDKPVIQAMLEYEADPALAVLTGGKNILEYMEERGAHFDPHAHTNNYADIVYLMKQLGITPTGVIGGTIHVGCGDDYLDFLDLVSWHEEINLNKDGFVYGEDYPEAKWQPTVLSDPGMGGHYFDDWSSGVWQPGDAEDFYTNFTTSDIVYIGEGYPHNSTVIGDHQASGAEVFSGNGQYIKELVQKIANKEFPTGTESGQEFMYTASIHVRDTAIVSEGEDDETVTIEGLRMILEELQPLADDGKIVFIDFEGAAEIWKSEYDSVPWRVDLSSFSFYDKVKNQAEDFCESRKPGR